MPGRTPLNSLARFWKASLLRAALISLFLTACSSTAPGAGTELEMAVPGHEPASSLLDAFMPFTVSGTGLDIAIPSQEDWVDYGTIFEAGKEGDWDLYLWGGFTNTAVKKDGTYFLYYQGASDYRYEPDETVVWRAIGVATSPDGVNFTKYDGNPVVTWFPSGYADGNGEEGAVSGGVTLDTDGEIALYYGANTAFNKSLVHADGRLAVSSDGFNFTDVGPVLEFDDNTIWGSGDELFPIAALQDAGNWLVYYLPNGLGIGRKLGVAWGDAPDNLSQSAQVLSGISGVSAWGTAGIARVSPETYALFLNWVPDPRLEVRLVSLAAPDSVSDVVATYRFDDLSQATVLLDEESRTWFMYYRDQEADRYGVKLAPAGPVDLTPPGAPAKVTAESVGGGEILLSWQPATDDDTGVVLYKVFRDGQEVASVKDLQFVDSDLDAQTTYRYAVSAVNYHGQEGEPAEPVLVTARSGCRSQDEK